MVRELYNELIGFSQMYECLVCGALVFNKGTHTLWHDRLNGDIIEVSAQARRYVHPPVYGGS